MNQDLSKTMYAASYIRAKKLRNERARLLIQDHKEEDLIQKYINEVNEGMFTNNIKTREYYFNKELKVNNNEFEQLLILGIGLDTKADTIENLSDKKVVGLDMCASIINNIYNKQNLTTKATILHCDLTNIEPEKLKDELLIHDFSFKKRTVLLWEGGTFYIEARKVFEILGFFIANFNITGVIADFLNEKVLSDKEHPKRKTIDKVLNFLEKNKEPWIGQFNKEVVTDYFSSKGFSSVIQPHQEVERYIVTHPIVLPNLLFFVSAFKK